MSLSYFGRNQKFGLCAIWRIEESRSFFLNELNLPEKQIPAMEGMREIEWLASRFLANKIDQINPNEIAKDEYGKPFCKNSEIHLTISHSHDYAAYGSANHPIGIDLQIQKPKIKRIAEKYTNPEEILVLPDQFSEEEKLHLIWTIKEAVFKLYGRKELPFRKGIRIQKCAQNEKFFETIGTIIKANDKRKFACSSFLANGYYFTKAVFAPKESQWEKSLDH